MTRVSEGGLYLNGRGVISHTHELVDRMWDAMLGGVLGMSLVPIGPLVAWASLIHRFAWDQDKPGTFTWVVFWIICAVSIIGGVWLALPWFKACRAVRKHTEAMEAETALRGKGWASS